MTTPKTSQDTVKGLPGRRASVQSVDSGFIATQSSRNSQDGTSLTYGQNSQSVILQQQSSLCNLTVGSESPSPRLAIAARALSHPLQRVKQGHSETSLWSLSKHPDHHQESGVSIDEDDDTESDTDLEKEDMTTKVNAVACIYNDRMFII